MSFTFDDGRIDQYTNARPLLKAAGVKAAGVKAAGVKATFFVISDALTWGSTNMNASQIRAMTSDG